MIRFLFFFFVTFLFSTSVFGQKKQLDTLALIPIEIKEISSMVVGKSGAIWAINDSGNEPIMYQMSNRGEIISQCLLTNANNQDWEELTTDPAGYIYIGDFGNNKNQRENLVVYRVHESELLANTEIVAEVISFTYPDQTAFPPEKSKKNFDMEAMIYYNNKLMLFSKNRTNPFTGYTTLYTLPAAPGTYVAEKVDSLYLGKGPKELFQITGADVSPDGKNLILMSYDKCFVVFDFPYNDVFGGRVQRIDFAQVSQKESVIWVADSTVLIADEKSVLGGGNLYQMDLSAEIKANGEVRKQEVQIPMKEFRDTLELYVDLSVRGTVSYEFFSSEGNRVSYESMGYFDRGKHVLKITPTEFMNGAYLLNVQVGKRPHAFFVYRFNAVDWKKVEAKFEKRKKEIQKRQSSEPVK